MTLAVRTVLELVGSQAERAPEASTILAPDRTPLTYRALMASVDGAIDALAAAGFGRGDRVALALPNGPEMGVALLAVMGCAECAPLNPALDEASYLVALRALAVAAVVVPEGDGGAAVRAARALALPILRLGFDASEPAGTFALRSEAPRPAKRRMSSEPADVALVLQTSGTTARPKVVSFTQRNLAVSARTRVRLVRHTNTDRCLCVAPLFSGMGIRRCLLPVLASGGNIVCTPGFDARLFFGWLAEFEPTFYVAVPAIHQAVLEEIARCAVPSRSTLRFIGSESVTLPAAVEAGLEAAFGVPIVQGYGLTETGLIAQTPLPPEVRRTGSVGRPVDIEIALLEHDAAVTRSETPSVGEIAVRGDGVFGGYEGDAEANREAFRDGWFRTGDLGYVDRDGFLFIVGRAKELINRGGTKVSPTAVDAALLAHPAVRDAATFPVPHPTLGEDVVVAVVLRESVQVTPRQLRDFAFEHLPAFAVPSRVVMVAALQRTARGKLRRDKLADVLSRELRVAPSPPRDAGEERVASLFAEVLGRETVGAFDHFFELGGDSLSGARLIARVNSELQANIGVESLFRRPTVAEFAVELAYGPWCAGESGTRRTAGPAAVSPRRCLTHRPGSTKDVMIELHYFPGNASLAVHILLEELGVPFELRLVDRANAAHKSPEYLKLNPNGQIPVLVDGDLVLYETVAICMHLADTHPRARLAPPVATSERAHYYKWFVWCTNTLQAMLMHYFYGDRMVDDGNSAAAAQVKAHAEARIGSMLDQLDAQLASHGREWLLGTFYSAVDPLAMLLCRWTRGFARPARSLPHLGPYLQRVLERPAVQRAFATEKLQPPLV